MRFPLTIYRIQEEIQSSIFPYLQKLGISDISGNFFPNILFSTKKENSVVQEASQYDMGILFDFWLHYFPYSCEHPVVKSLFEYGLQSPYFSFLDMDWNTSVPLLNGKLLAPFLSRSYTECLESGQISLQFVREGLRVCYGNYFFPVKVTSYYSFFSHNLQSLENSIGEHHSDVVQFCGALYMFQSLEAVSSHTCQENTLRLCQEKLWELYNKSHYIHKHVQELLILWNGKPGIASSFNLLDAFLAEQYFHLAFCRTAFEESNYRFWECDPQKICLNLTHNKVFRHIQDFLLQWLNRQKNLGVRIMSGDAISNVIEYCQLFHNDIPHVYWTIETKCDTYDEWFGHGHIQGVANAEFQNHLQKILAKTQSDSIIINGYRPFAHTTLDSSLLQKQYSRMVLENLLIGEVLYLYDLLRKGLQNLRWGRDANRYEIFRTLMCILTNLSKPLQNLDRFPQSQRDKSELQMAISQVLQQHKTLEHICHTLERYFFATGDSFFTIQEQQPLWHNAIQQLQKISYCLVAKTKQKMMQEYPGLLSSQSIGDTFLKPEDPLSTFHEWQQWRQENLPKSWNSTYENGIYTEDAWARLQVLSEIPEIWSNATQHWAQYNQSAKPNFHGEPVPSPDLEYFIYQSLLATCPMEIPKLEWTGIAWDWLQKYVQSTSKNIHRETHKLGYYHAVRSFVARILYPSEDNIFIADFATLHTKVSYYGMLNSLSQLVIKCTSPGIPEIRQGSELWNFSSSIKKDWETVLHQAISWVEDWQDSNNRPNLADCMRNFHDGKIKCILTHVLLRLRKEYVDIFQQGYYLPIHARGSKSDHIVSFCRYQNKLWICIVVPRFCVSLGGVGELPIGDVWQDTVLELPENAPRQWNELFTAKSIILSSAQMPVSIALQNIPVAIWIGERNTEKRSKEME